MHYHRNNLFPYIGNIVVLSPIDLLLPSIVKFDRIGIRDDIILISNVPKKRTFKTVTGFFEYRKLTIYLTRLYGEYIGIIPHKVEDSYVVNTDCDVAYIRCYDFLREEFVMIIDRKYHELALVFTNHKITLVDNVLQHLQSIPKDTTVDSDYIFNDINQQIESIESNNRV